MVSLGKKLVVAFTYGCVLGFLLYCIGLLVMQAVGINIHLDLAGFATGFAGSTAVTLAEDLKEGSNRQNG